MKYTDGLQLGLSAKSKDPKADIGTALTDYEGMESMEIEAALTQQLLDHLVTEHELPNVQLGEKGKWRVISSLQKAVRRGDLEAAERAVVALYNGGEEWYVWRRIGIISLEDIGIAAPRLAATAFTIAKTTTKWKKENGGVYLLLAVVEQMVETVCDRTLCNLAYSSWCHPENKQYFDWVGEYDLGELLGSYFEPTEEVCKRQLAGLALTGFLSIGERKEKVSSAAALGPFMECLRDSTYPNLIQFVIHKGFSAGTEGLHMALPIVYDYFSEEDVTIGMVDMPEAPLVKSLPSVAYDMHTLEGKRAYAYFSKSCEEAAKWLVRNPDSAAPVKVIGSAAFGIESGNRLVTYLDYDFKAQMDSLSYDTDAARWNVSREAFDELMQIVWDNLDKLNYARKRIVEGK